MRKSAFFIAVLIFVLFTFSGVYAKEPKLVYDTKLFDTKVEKLPPNYNGHDIYHLINNLREIDNPSLKDEFETTEEYEKRIEADSVTTHSFWPEISQNACPGRAMVALLVLTNRFTPQTHSPKPL